MDCCLPADEEIGQGEDETAQQVKEHGFNEKLDVGWTQHT
jgi:hypothetical protein